MCSFVLIVCTLYTSQCAHGAYTTGILLLDLNSSGFVFPSLYKLHIYNKGEYVFAYKPWVRYF